MYKILLQAFQAFTTHVLKKVFSNFELEARKVHIPCVFSTLINDLALDIVFDAKLDSMGDAYMPAGISGVVTSPPSEYYPFTSLPQAMLTSRPGYEHLLRRLIRRDCENIRWINGVVTGVVPSTDRQHINEVTIELFGEEKVVKQKATLVVGSLTSTLTYPELSLTMPICRCNWHLFEWSQVAQRC